MRLIVVDGPAFEERLRLDRIRLIRRYSELTADHGCIALVQCFFLIAVRFHLFKSRLP